MIDDPSDLAVYIHQLRLDLDELKGQQLFGYDSVLMYRTASSDDYDISVSLAAGQSQSYDITLQHRTATGGALLVMNAYYRLGNPDVMASPVDRNTQTNDVSWMKLASNSTNTVWRLKIQNETITTGYTAYVKLFFDGTDTGSFIVAPA